MLDLPLLKKSGKMLLTNSSDENGQFNIRFKRSYSLNFKAESNISKPYENTVVKPN